ncbi:MAG: hypothetical protein IH968_06730 [Gemmatimonadetes bacterium]|nr:hypothetical protein [Gemmatimonadota bacterium]
MTRQFGVSSTGLSLLLSGGIRVSGYAQGGIETAGFGLLGAKIPLTRADSWSLDITGQIGVAHRRIGAQSVTARANRVTLALDLGQVLLSFGHDDAAGSSSPFIYGGAARASISWRIR